MFIFLEVAFFSLPCSPSVFPIILVVFISPQDIVMYMCVLRTALAETKTKYPADKLRSLAKDVMASRDELTTSYKYNACCLDTSNICNYFQ